MAHNVTNDDRHRATTDESTVDQRLDVLRNEDTPHGIAYLAHDVQMDLQRHLDLGYEEVEVVYAGDGYVIVAGPEIWPTTRDEFRTDAWSAETTDALIEDVENLHLDLARKKLGDDDYAQITGTVDVAVIFTK